MASVALVGSRHTCPSLCACVLGVDMWYGLKGRQGGIAQKKVSPHEV